MGATLASLRLHGGRRTLTGGSELVASVVPDVSGIDKVFDYRVPASMAGAVVPGVRVTVPLHGRTVKGWVVAAGSREELARDHEVPDSLSEITRVAGRAMSRDMVPLTRAVARRWRGPWRAVLTSASAPRVRPRTVTGRTSHGARSEEAPADMVRFLDDGGGVALVPPGASSLHLVVAAARRGAVLVVCPTHRMARLGAAWLRRAGLTTAEVPDEWERAEAGVDVVIGARSSVWAPCPGLGTVIVVDEHDDALKEERIPAWDAAAVAVMRAEAAGVAWVLASPVPSARAMRLAGDRSLFVSGGGWPRVIIEDLGSSGAPASLLGSSLLAEVTRPGSTVACVLTTVGGARLMVCDVCRAVQRCPVCAGSLSSADDGRLTCMRCRTAHGTVCVRCGREKLRTLRGGHAHLGRELERSTGRAVTLVSGDSDAGDVAGRVLVGTEAVLHRVSGLDTVVLADADRDLLAPRVEAPREFLALAARAARAVGQEGVLVVQTRIPDHPVLRALDAPDPSAALLSWLEGDIATRRALGLPPFSEVVSVTYAAGTDPPALPVLPEGVVAAPIDRGWILRSASPEALDGVIAAVRAATGPPARVLVDPRRY